GRGRPRRDRGGGAGPGRVGGGGGGGGGGRAERRVRPPAGIGKPGRVPADADREVVPERVHGLVHGHVREPHPPRDPLHALVRAEIGQQRRRRGRGPLGRDPGTGQHVGLVVGEEEHVGVHHLLGRLGR